MEETATKLFYAENAHSFACFLEKKKETKQNKPWKEEWEEDGQYEGALVYQLPSQMSTKAGLDVAGLNAWQALEFSPAASNAPR